MTLRKTLLAGGLCLFSICLVSPARAEEESGRLPQDYLEMAARIDQLLTERWQQEQVAPSPPASDAEFLRRTCLDLTGVVPTVALAREFLDGVRPDATESATSVELHRRRLVDRLLSSPRYASHMATVWRTRMLPEQFDPGQLPTAMGLERWLRQQFARNLRYDNLVADLVASSGTRESGPALYFTALELKPEKLAASTARIFMGLQIQCAECHNHPFDHWTQQDFWGYAAFFAQLEGAGDEQPFPRAVNVLRDSNRGEVTLPDQEDPVAPKFPAGQLSSQELGGTRRQQLAIWLASRDNPYLARAAVNWAWAHLFGRGLVDPVDDLGKHNPASHPQLMEELAIYFERNGFDVQDLLRTLCSTKAYQLSSRREGGEAPAELYAQMAVKTLTAEQYYDSLARCLTQAEAAEGPTGQAFDQRRVEFIVRMQTAARSALEYENGPRQALQLMNGPLTGEATSIEQSALLGSLEAPFFTDRQRLETLFLATLSRPP
ncbi:MAG: DUF1549 domain-containing protein, partial [Planctomycetales bacterium]|nr:DUF1549 domain-containing protein [Planctomycetales bacterium]